MRSGADRVAEPLRQKWFRADRFATLYMVHPIRQWMAPHRALHIPILMYHSVSEQDSGGRHPYFETTTSPRVFAQHMEFLKESGYQTLTLHEAIKYIEAGGQDIERLVVLTFDDGFQDFYTQAFPILADTDIPPQYFFHPDTSPRNANSSRIGSA